MRESSQLLSFAILSLTLMPSMMVFWELCQSPWEQSQTLNSWLVTSFLHIMNDSAWSYFAWIDCLFGFMVIIYYSLQWLFGEFSEDEITAVGETVFNFLAVKVIWTFLCLDVDIWEIMIWATWLTINCFLLTLSTILLLRARLAVSGLQRASFSYYLIALVLLHIIWIWAIATAYSLFWDELSAVAIGFDFIVQMTSDAWLALLNILRADTFFFYWGWCSRRGTSCDQHIVHSLNFAGRLINQLTNFLATLHLWWMKGVFTPTVTWLLIIWRVSSKFNSIKKLVGDYWSYYSVLKRINNIFPEAPLDKIKSELCTICREHLKPGAKVVPCGHIFHASCLEAWMRMKRECPNCRTNLEVNKAPSDPPTSQRQSPTPINFSDWITGFFTQTSHRTATGAMSGEITPDNLQSLIEMFPEHSALEISRVFRSMGSVPDTTEYFLRSPPDSSNRLNTRAAYGLNPALQNAANNAIDLLSTNPYATPNRSNTLGTNRYTHAPIL